MQGHDVQIISVDAKLKTSHGAHRGTEDTEGI